MAVPANDFDSFTEVAYDPDGRPLDVGYRGPAADTCEAEDVANELALAVMWCFNPPDEDGAQSEILLGALFAARDYIAAQPCRCEKIDCGGPEPEYDDPCPRCQVLGRLADEGVSR
jgi:hypothetical protein